MASWIIIWTAGEILATHAPWLKVLLAEFDYATISHVLCAVQARQAGVELRLNCDRMSEYTPKHVYMYSIYVYSNPRRGTSENRTSENGW